MKHLVKDSDHIATLWDTKVDYSNRLKKIYFVKPSVNKLECVQKEPTTCIHRNTNQS